MAARVHWPWTCHRWHSWDDYMREWRYWRKANAKSELPAATATYWRPPTEYVIGPDATTPPTENFHSGTPVRAFNATKQPSRTPVNTRSDAVVLS